MSLVEFKERLITALGGEWPQGSSLEPYVVEVERKEGIRLEKVSYEVGDGNRVPAFLLVPDSATAENPAPGICLWHQHARNYEVGKSEPAGLAGAPMHHTGMVLAREGYVVLCPDTIGFEERQDNKLKGAEFERFLFLKYVVEGKSLAWKNILDMRRAVDYLASRPEVQRDNLGCYGHSMGSTHAWLAAPFEPRLKAIVANCCLPTYAGIHREKLLHCFPNYVPGIYRYGDTPDIVSLIAPRPLHMNFGELDWGSPIEDVRWGVQKIAETYRLAEAEENFTYYIEPNAGHVFSEKMRELTKQFFNKHLRDAAE